MTKSDLKPFPAAVCERIRNLVALKKKSEAEKKRMHDVRDQALEQYNEASKNQDQKKADTQLKAYGSAVLDIKRLDREVKWCDGEISTAVENGDQADLFDDVDIKVPDFRPGLEQPEEDDEDQQKIDPRPVGRPGKKPAAAPDPGVGDGINEHLRVSINELDINEAIKGKLIKAGCQQVIQVTMVLDQVSIDHRASLDLNENQYSALKKSVAAFRAKHTQAIESEFKGGGGGTDGVVKGPRGTRVGRGAGLKLAE